MKKSAFMCTLLACTALFMIGNTSTLEARRHSRTSVAVNYAPYYPVYRPAYIVETPRTYVQERVYVDPCGYPTYVERTPHTVVERVYVQPRPVVRPSWFSFGFFFR